ncbi:MAG: hypothetical protein FJX72_10130 [Armatimonadetes bacterium]|nr:hypothetical protein [Armatimonadota bacterium]
MVRLKVATVCALTACALGASALPVTRGEFIKAYKLKPTSKIAQAQCNLCHVPNTNKLNAFGADLNAAMKAAKTKKLTAQVMKIIGAKDSDKDKASNAAEIKADTLPGDPKSKPAK